MILIKKHISIILIIENQEYAQKYTNLTSMLYLLISNIILDRNPILYYK